MMAVAIFEQSWCFLKWYNPAYEIVDCSELEDESEDDAGGEETF